MTQVNVRQLIKSSHCKWQQQQQRFHRLDAWLTFRYSKNPICLILFSNRRLGSTYILREPMSEQLGVKPGHGHLLAAYHVFSCVSMDTVALLQLFKMYTEEVR